MAPTYVALDIETTGLDPEADEVTEVAAVKFDEERVLDTFHTLVNPHRPMPYRIERLTSISADSLREAPSFAAIASRLAAFLGGLPLVGQNLSFDVSFLEKRGVSPAGPTYDTYDLARLLLPHLPDYSLRRLAQHLGIRFKVRHRALADAEAARQVFLALRSRLAERPVAFLAELERLAALAGWGLRGFFRELLEAKPRGPSLEVRDSSLEPRPSKPRDGARPLSPVEERQPVEADEVEALLEGLTSLPKFERRPEQAAMARAVAEALSAGEHLIVEAGTGVGKSLAYLLPAACFALRNRERAVISTNTISLQEQLQGQDVPILRRALEGWSPAADRPPPKADPPLAEAELRVAQLKGRRNYLCLLRWAALRRSQALSPAEAKLLARILLWLSVTETGDRAELSLTQDEESAWNRLSAQNEACLASQCFYVREGTCFLLRARRRAEAAHLLIVNHALLLSDLAVGGRLLPEYSHLIVDEAQHLEDEATQQFGFQVSEGDLSGFLDRIHQRSGRGAQAGPAPRSESGLVATLRQAVRPSASALGPSEFTALSQSLATGVEAARKRLPPFFDRVRAFIREHAPEESDYDQRLLLSARGGRVQPDWSDVEVAWHQLDTALAELLPLLEELLEALDASGGENILDYDALVSEVAELLAMGQELRKGMKSIISGDDAGRICWLAQSSGTGRVSLNSAPLQVADLLRDELFERKDSVILTSATLSARGGFASGESTQGDFRYLRQRVGLEESRELLLGSPFDYECSTLLLVPQEMPEPGERGYQSALEQTLLDLCRASRGRALVLFTSYAALRATYFALKSALEREEILPLGHGIDGTPKQILAALRENPRTVVMGTATFWEGVDVVGEALSLLVVARLPFSVPTDPVFQARSELFDEPFLEYALPQAVLRFKQGFGRLIRRKTDRGVVAVLDRRIRSRNYGSAFLRSLPPCTVREVALEEMPSEVEEWLARK